MVISSDVASFADRRIDCSDLRQCGVIHHGAAKDRAIGPTNRNGAGVNLCCIVVPEDGAPAPVPPTSAGASRLPPVSHTLALFPTSGATHVTRARDSLSTITLEEERSCRFSSATTMSIRR